jgi:sporulation protein YqfC
VRKGFRQELSEILELPLDVSLDLPKVTILGSLGVLIENHRGLIQYSPQKMVIGVGRGQISISGRDLQIEEVDREDVVVKGLIETVQMEVQDRSP